MACGTVDGVLQDCAVCQVWDQITGLRDGAQSMRNRIRLSMQAWEMCSCNRQTFILWAGNTNLQMLNSWETSETTAWEMSTHEVWYTVHAAEFYVLCSEIECYCMRHQTEMIKLESVFFHCFCIREILCFLHSRPEKRCN